MTNWITDKIPLFTADNESKAKKHSIIIASREYIYIYNTLEMENVIRERLTCFSSRLFLIGSFLKQTSKDELTGLVHSKYECDVITSQYNCNDTIEDNDI